MRWCDKSDRGVKPAGVAEEINEPGQEVQNDSG